MNNTIIGRYRVLITRSREQSSQFEKNCQAAGFDTCLMPSLRIDPIVVEATQWHRELAIARAVLFTSTNAVTNAHRQQALPWSDKDVYAIGAATARALGDVRQKLAITPLAPYNSESFLQQIAALTPSNLLIIKGIGGRNLIQSELQTGGWQVRNLDVYKRERPATPAEKIDSVFLHTPPDIVSITSNEVLENLWHLCAAHRQTLCATALVVNSERCRDLAIKLGFRKQILVAASAGDDGQLSAMVKWTQTSPVL